MKKPRVWESKTWLHKKYVLENKTEQQIADLCGAHQTTIHKWLVRHGLK